ncbi:hypothetical protein [Silicimonas sp. MF1-12-2]|uniref:hypothetical protein n=1 Tax=Silicimonas sp. MF1-12-2 TaxID=3384793 RepID=UPI0039B6E077
MGGLKTLLAALAVTATSAAPVRADDDLVRTFATCAGRLSATMEHQWLMGDGEAELTERRRISVIAILDALTPEDRGPEILNWRIEAKMALASLLTRATFNDDSEDAAWAERQAQMMIGSCNSLILS